jgi:hypothetical protein
MSTIMTCGAVYKMVIEQQLLLFQALMVSR